jgi:hypothetical protein
MTAADKIAAKPPEKAPEVTGAALAVEQVEIDTNCVGIRWTAADIDLLASVIAIIAMGQAAHAARILNELLRAQPVVNRGALKANAKERLIVSGTTKKQKEARRYHRDGLIFEAISWAAAQQHTAGKVMLRDPHISATTQGLDGLMIELDQSGAAVMRATIFEDKCSENPIHTFRYKIMRAFTAHHEDKRASDLLATAAALLGRAGLDGTASVTAAARVLDKKYRAYRASLAVTTADDSLEHRRNVFKTYGKLKGIEAAQRVGGLLVTSENLRNWFDEVAGRAIAYVDSLGNEVD